MIIKVNTGSVNQKFQIDDDITVLELKRILRDKLKIPVYEQELLIGFPPKPLQRATAQQRVGDIGILNGCVITVRISATKISYFQKLLELGYAETTVVKTLESAEQYSFEEALEACNAHNLTQPSILRLEKVSIPADNSCLFNSVCHLLKLHDEPQHLREIIGKVIESDPVTYTEEFLDKKPLDYINWILHPDHWGGEIEISILSSFFEVEIVVFDIRSTVCLHYGEGKGYSRKILLLYDGIHYDGLIQRDQLTKQPILQFDVADRAVIEQAQDFTRELQQKKQFVNLSTGHLYCNDCYTVLTGEKQVVEHAKSTGHTNFGQKV